MEDQTPYGDERGHCISRGGMETRKSERGGRREYDPVHCALESERLDRLVEDVLRMRHESAALTARLAETNLLLNEIKTQLEVMRVKSGLIGTIAALMVGGGMMILEWVRSKGGH